MSSLHDAAEDEPREEGEGEEEDEGEVGDGDEGEEWSVKAQAGGDTSSLASLGSDRCT